MAKSKLNLWQRLDWRQALAIDLGSSEVRIFRTRRHSSKAATEELLIEPACVAVKPLPQSASTKRRVLAIGTDALEMEGRLGKEVEVIYPIVAGRIIDQELAKALLRSLLKQVLQLNQHLPVVLSPVVAVTVRAGTSDFARGQLSRLFYSLGASEVYLVAEPLAAAIGSGVPVADAAGAGLMQLGAGSVEAAAISLGSMTAFESNLLTPAAAGWDVDDLIQAYLMKEHQLSVAKSDLIKLKKELLLDVNSKKTFKVLGRDLVSQQAQTIKVKNSDFLPILEPVAASYLQLLDQLFKKVPQELLKDILDHGLLLAGNLAKLNGLDFYLAQHLKMPVALVDDPDLAAAKGVLTILENLDQFKEGLGHA